VVSHQHAADGFGRSIELPGDFLDGSFDQFFAHEIQFRFCPATVIDTALGLPYSPSTASLRRSN
jgi:hypothetical protein